jgi:Domain of unknown function (DUF5076)
MQLQLPVPPAAAGDARAIELLRVWAAHGKQHVSLATNIWNDPAAWGVMLVDLARHIANAYQQTEEQDYASVLNRIREGFDAEWGTATDEPSGKVLE